MFRKLKKTQNTNSASLRKPTSSTAHVDDGRAAAQDSTRSTPLVKNLTDVIQPHPQAAETTRAQAPEKGIEEKELLKEFFCQAVSTFLDTWQKKEEEMGYPLLVRAAKNFDFQADNVENVRLFDTDVDVDSREPAELTFLVEMSGIRRWWECTPIRIVAGRAPDIKMPNLKSERLDEHFLAMHPGLVPAINLRSLTKIYHLNYDIDFRVPASAFDPRTSGVSTLTVKVLDSSHKLHKTLVFNASEPGETSLSLGYRRARTTARRRGRRHLDSRW